MVRWPALAHLALNLGQPFKYPKGVASYQPWVVTVRRSQQSSFQGSKGVVQFLVARRAGDVMPYHAAEDLCLNRRQFAKNILDHCSAYGHERVSVVHAPLREAFRRRLDLIF